MVRVKKKLLKMDVELYTERRHSAMCFDDIAQLSKKVVKTEEAVEFERVRCVELERKLAESASYIGYFEGQQQGIDTWVQKAAHQVVEERFCTSWHPSID